MGAMDTQPQRQILYRFTSDLSAGMFLVFLLGGALWLSASSPVRADIVHLAFSSDGRYLASLDSSGALYVNDAESHALVCALRDVAKGDSLAWRPNTYQIAVALDEGRGWDLYLVQLDGTRQRLTQHPAQDCSPQWMEKGKKLVFVSYRDNDADLYELDMDTMATRPLAVQPYDQWEPQVSPGADSVVFLSQEGAGTQIRLSAPGREPSLIGSPDPLHQFPDPLGVSWDLTGQYVLYTEQELGKTNLRLYNSWTRENAVLLTDVSIEAPLAAAGPGWLFTGSEQGLFFYKFRGMSLIPDSRKLLRPWGFSLSRPALSVAKGEPVLAAVVENRGVALSKPVSEAYSFVFYEVNDYLAHAERLEVGGYHEEAEAVYRGLLAGPITPEQTVSVRLHHAAQLRRKGRIQEALDELGMLSRLAPSSLDPQRVRALQADILLFESKDYAKAGEILLSTAGKSPANSDVPDEDTGAPFHEPLAVLQSRDRELIQIYADAHAALRKNNPPGCLDALLLLAKRHASHPLACGIVLNLLGNPYAGETLSRSSNPFSSAALRGKTADILLLLEKEMREAPSKEQTDPAARGSGPADSTRENLYEELFQSLIQARRFNEAQKVALRILQTEGSKAFGVPNFLEYYLESDRTDTYVHNLLSKVLLTPELIPVLASQLDPDPLSRSRLELARIKLALLEGDPDAAQKLLVSCQRLFQDYSATQILTREVAGQQWYLYLFAGKRFERQGDWGKAIEKYQVALSLLEKYAPEKTKYYFQLRAALEELDQHRANAAALWQMQLILRGMGDAILNPTNQPSQLRIGVRNLLELLRTTSPSSLDTFLLYQIGYALSRCESPHYAAYYLDRALDARPSDALRAAILWEKTAVFETSENWWLELRACKDLADCTPSPAQRDAVRLKSVQALLHLGMHPEAREVLRAIRDTSSVPSLCETARQQLEVLDLQKIP